MKNHQKFFCVLAALIAGQIALGLSRALAQTNSTLVLTDEGAVLLGNPGIDGMELRGSGFYWWKKGAGFGAGEFDNYEPTLGIKGNSSRYSLALNRNYPFYMIRGGSTFISGAARDGSYAYFTANRGGSQVGLFRQALSAATNSAPQRLAGIVGTELVSPGAIGRLGSDLFFAPTYQGGYTAIWRAAFDEAGTYTGSGVVAEGGLTPPYAVTRLAFFNATIAGSYRTYGLCLQSNGDLWRFGPLNTGGLQPMIRLAGAVGDIGVRNEDGGIDVQTVREEIYATSNPATGGATGRLFRINPATGAQTNVFVEPNGLKFPAFGFDNDFLFLSRTNGASGEILRKYLPYRSAAWYYKPVLETATIPGNVQGWVTMENVSGTNLRSDGQWLYFTRGQQVRRVGTTAPPISLDVQAFGIEAVQIVQDFNNSVPLIEGRQVMVRGYARLAANSAGGTQYPAATLAVFHNGAGGEIFYPVSSPAVDGVAAAELGNYRGSATRSYLFLIPAEVVRRGTMSFTMSLNSTRSIVETGVANPYGNNTVSTPPITVIASSIPNLICLPVAVDGLEYTIRTDPPAFWNQIARARSLLPVLDLRVKTAAVTIYKPVARFGIPPWVNRSFDLPQNKTAALNWLRYRIVTTGIYFQSGDNHFLGMVHPAIEDTDPNSIFEGGGSRSGETLLVRMRGTPNGSAWNGPQGGQTLAHELGHNYGLKHVNCSAGNTPAELDGAYPWIGCQIGPSSNNLATSIFGWDPLTGSIIDGTQVADTMSYGLSTWMSAYSINCLLFPKPLFPFGAPPAPAGAAAPLAQNAAAEGGAVFLIPGMINPSLASAELWPAQCVPDGTYHAGVVADSMNKAAQPQGHDYVVRQLDAAGAVLGETALVMEKSSDPEANGARGFVQFVAALPGAQILQIAKGSTALAQIRASANVPAVAVDVPVYDPDAQLLRWSWTASDGDGDPVLSMVQFSADDGVTWQTTDTANASASTTIDARDLPGAAQCRLRLIATDGFNAAVAMSESFALPTHPPDITIIGVTEGQKLPSGTQIQLSAFAMDTEEGSLPPAGISWDLSGPESRVASGPSLSLAGLSPGAWSVTASALDGAGEVGIKTIGFEVRGVEIPAVPGAPALNGELDDAVYAQAPVIRWKSGTNSESSARLIRSGGRLYVGFSNLPYTQSVPPSRVGIRVDIDGSGDALPQPDDLAFFLTEEGRPLQWEGNGVSMVPRADPAPGFDSALNEGENGWTAEFCLPEALLGGTGHTIRVMLTMDVPFGVAGTRKYTWPPAADGDSPATWALMQLGMLPPPENAPPLAHAGADRSVEPVEPLTITLDGGGSSDPEGEPLTYLWTQVAGDSVTLTRADTARPSFSIGPVAATATMQFQLVVNDGLSDSAPALVSITASSVTPPPPPREIPRFALYPDGTAEGYFSASELSLSATGTSGGPGGGIGTQGLYSIESSEDMLTWTPGPEISPDVLGRLIFTDLSAPGVPRRFYRPRHLGAEGILTPGSALSFDGAPRSVQVPHSTALNSYPLTVSAWIKTTSTSASVAGVVSKYADGSSNGWSIFLSGGRLYAWYTLDFNRQVFTPPWGLQSGFVADGQWHHVALAIGDFGGKLFVDGVSHTHLPWTGAPGAATTTAPLQIGRYHNYPNGFTGEIDEVSVWSAAFSDLQILDLRRRGPTGTEANLEALWTCDDGTGTQLNDSTAAGHHGTLISDPAWVESTAPIYR